MSIQKQMIPVTLDGGLATKEDPKRVIAGRALVMENAIYISPGQIKKRPGYAGLTTSTLDGSTISVGQALISYNNELLLCDKTTIYSYDAANTKWVNKGAAINSGSSAKRMPSPYVTQQQIIRNNYTQSNQDSATMTGAYALQCFVWEDSQGGSRYCVIDTATGLAVMPPTLILATAIKPKVLAVQGGLYFAIFYINTADVGLYVATIAATAPTTALSPSQVNDPSQPLDSTKPLYDVSYFTADSLLAGDTGIPYGAGDRIWAFHNGTTDLHGRWSSTFNTPPWSWTGVTVTASPNTVTAMTVFKGYSGAFTQGPVFAWADGTSVKFTALNSALNVAGSGTIATIGSIVAITGIATSPGSTLMDFYYTQSAAQTWNYLTTRASYFVYVSVTSLTIRSVGLAGKAFMYGSGSHVPVAYESPLQPSYFVIDFNGMVVAKILGSNGGGLGVRSDTYGSRVLPESNPVNGTVNNVSLIYLLYAPTAQGAASYPYPDTWQFSFLQKDLLTTQSGQVYTQTGVTSVTLDFFDPKYSYSRVTHANTLHISGGCLQMYDGAGPVEHGFHLYPEPLIVQRYGETMVYGGIMGVPLTITQYDGGYTYQYVACYEWQDNQGQTHRSAPSAAVSYRHSIGIPLYGSTSVTVPTMRLTAKQNTRAPVRVVIYRTINNGTTFYQVTSVTSPLLNDTTADSVTFTDSTTDANLIGNPVLYTTGGVVQNGAPDACASMTTYQNRMVVLSSVNPLEEWYSKPVIPGSPVEFSPFFTRNIDPRGGGATAIATMDDKLVEFKASSIFFAHGQGPDNTGGQNDWSDSILITTDCGCTNPRSIVSMPKGLMFQSAKGIYLLDRSLGVSYVGADVEAYNSYTISSATLIASTNQVRFSLAGQNTILVYDYLMEKWSTFTNTNLSTALAAVDAALFQGFYTYLRASGVVCQESATGFGDVGSAWNDTALFQRMRILTSWLQFAGVQGFQRVYFLNILGAFKSKHNLLIKIGFDFDPTTQQSGYPVGCCYAPGTVQVSSSAQTGGGPTPYQVGVHLFKQKCEAVQISLEDTPSGGVVGESFSLSALAFEVGIKGGVYRLPSAATVG